ncbi:hypothetical protein ACRALDRAFT_208513 [Sodiomyces alcalophilus JCM 7366]|uniref:uncharacterized protein n=1 Tax=Sodiomyces alcalophilus JCM 7366 TaxID=591952 RepID=UPI0039B5998C
MRKWNQNDGAIMRSKTMGRPFSELLQRMYWYNHCTWVNPPNVPSSHLQITPPIGNNEPRLASGYTVSVHTCTVQTGTYTRPQILVIDGRVIHRLGKSHEATLPQPHSNRKHQTRPIQSSRQPSPFPTLTVLNIRFHDFTQVDHH